ncbi:Crp/Fnr family transcriptional regulator [Chitinophaga lutea]|uniref:Crp/Fnr family transcriptional regulator n=2 Tax=Chitinophaga lutea TaxID=2488634 RepID=A0A3N4Q100_9BACT|nr:Crp/Fnr family transcriptional regulator [Chitinophaga lutea]
MTEEPLIQHILRHIPLDEAEKALVLSLFSEKQLPKKAYLLRQGEVCKTENFIAAGCMRMYSTDANGQEHILTFGVEGWWISDLYSFFTGAPSAYSIDALEDTRLLQITRPALERLYEKVPRLERFFRILLQNAFVAHQHRIHQNLSFTAEQRYLEFRARYPLLEQRVSQKHLAAYLGITPEFLSTLRRKLARR